MKFYKAIGRLEWGMSSLGAGLCLFVMMIITVLSVFGRYVLQVDLIPGAYNIVERILFPLLVFLALPLAHREGIFPRLELFTETLPTLSSRLISIGVLLVELVIFLILLWYVGRFAWNGFLSGRTMQIGSDYWPLWPILAMVPLAFALMVIEMLYLIGRDIATISGRATNGTQK